MQGALFLLGWTSIKLDVQDVMPYIFQGLPRWRSGKESAYQCRRHRRLEFDPWVGKIPWRMKQLPTLVFWPRGGSERKYMCLLSHFLVLKVSSWSLYPWFTSNHYYSLGNICGRTVSSLGLALWQDGSVQDTLDEFFLDTFDFSSFPDFALYIPWQPPHHLSFRSWTCVLTHICDPDFLILSR